MHSFCPNSFRLQILIFHHVSLANPTGQGSRFSPQEKLLGRGNETHTLTVVAILAARRVEIVAEEVYAVRELAAVVRG